MAKTMSVMGDDRHGNQAIEPYTCGRPEDSATVLAYHERSKHHPHRYARSLGYMDWATQPDPFRRYRRAPLLPLDLVPPTPSPAYDAVFRPGAIRPAPLGRQSISQLLQDALGLSAWKQLGTHRWPLRVNPSSGNLHPTEGYLLSGPITGISDVAAVYHYAVHDHALEQRLTLSAADWEGLAGELPESSVLIGLTSIHWRESWKYGERAFRYCQHDAGHAIAAIAIAAAGLGWTTHLCAEPTDNELSDLLGIFSQDDSEAEHPDCLLLVNTCGSGARGLRLRPIALQQLHSGRWAGTPNRLSIEHHDWPVISEVTAAAEKTHPMAVETKPLEPSHDLECSSLEHSVSLRHVLHQRRSAVAMDGTTAIPRSLFYRMMLQVFPREKQIPFSMLPWRPRVDLGLFVHRVEGLEAGLYLLARDPGRTASLRAAMRSEFEWATPEGCPAGLPLFRLQTGDVRRLAASASCEQDIAADGAFTVAMLTEYRASLEQMGSWFYRPLYWETGVVGQVLYLEAEAAGIRGTGIGCFFDDLTHQVFGLRGDQFQVLYHFTVGGPVHDDRLQTHPPYAHLDRPAQ